jgi:hypothetical protein
VRVNPHALQDETLQRQPQDTNDTEWKTTKRYKKCGMEWGSMKTPARSQAETNSI